MSNIDSPRILVLLVFGLPASGKTTLIQSIHESVEKGASVQEGEGGGKDPDSFICWKVIMDEIIPGSHQKEAIESGNWKHVRQSFIQATGLLIDGIKAGHMYSNDNNGLAPASGKATEAVPFYFMILERNVGNHQKVDSSTTSWPRKETNHVILVEDNLYYKSMRYEWIKMCRRKRIALGAINCSSSLDQCLLKNSLRSRNNFIPEEIITRMDQLFEPATRDEFFGHLLQVDNPHDVESSIKLIRSAIGSPFEPIDDDDEEQREIDRKLTLSNLIHQLDHLLRIVIKEILLECLDKQKLAKSLSNRKYVILSDVRQSKLILPEWFVNSLTKSHGNFASFDAQTISFAQNLLQR